MDRVDCIVAGAGVVGLAIARELSLRGLEVLILESADAIGTETSSRNSEVIHAGIYYEPGSLRAELCLEGKQRLYTYAAERGVPHRRCGKLIVATEPAQVPVLAKIRKRAESCGVHDLELIPGEAAVAMEPALRCHAALVSPSTGIIDSHALMLAFLGDAENAGAMLSLNTEILSGRIGSDGFVLQTRDGKTGERFEIGTTRLVNAAGLGANALAAQLQGFPPDHVPPLYMARGCYFAAAGKPAFSRLIYPVPEPGGLGVHLTLDLAGSMRFGPDVEWIDTKDYSVDPRRAALFYDEIRRYWPDLADDSLSPTYSGIRPKLAGPGAPAADFRIDGPTDHGQIGLVNLFGIESPGLTSSLAIADRVQKALTTC
ncbi:NAD(P)/FAD-dependent oxidoreductase [Tianweitania sediminis]|uniref:NAD(P)/FAD-dependent oxidoreductase n=1 Tax=Tianweitania sediminis TaxID=1502156 RepID=A0A8J7RP81_9HYPH|nr:NAD(P)/FAD-dependent oxidoreductase [Tianweitania sediminis]MBP0439479.1 NAD(P)/FAD-dependent oxidoreductase [Tianweitania sediminis]